MPFNVRIASKGLALTAANRSRGFAFILIELSNIDSRFRVHTIILNIGTLRTTLYRCLPNHVHRPHVVRFSSAKFALRGRGPLLIIPLFTAIIVIDCCDIYTI